MTSTAEQMRTYDGPAILSFGFRPFFLAGALWAAVAVALWIPMLGGYLDLLRPSPRSSGIHTN